MVYKVTDAGWTPSEELLCCFDLVVQCVHLSNITTDLTVFEVSRTRFFNKFKEFGTIFKLGWLAIVETVELATNVI